MISLRVLRRIIALFALLAAIAGCDLLKLVPKDGSTDIPPIVYKQNPDFIKGSVIVDSFVKRVWGGGTFEPLQDLHDAGLDWVRVGVTT
ncbi:MAG TPA: hypothetical protein DIT55_04475, partial [Spirochaetaceae bacterium]|nr:hypothetical protein [Spirochaetaceae bacterium]